jgi:CBS domain-containing protein
MNPKKRNTWSMTTNLPAATAGELMTAEVVTATAVTPVAELAHRLLDHAIGGLPVVDDDGGLIGMVSGFDVISKAGATTGEIMSRGVVSVGEEASVQEVVTLMGLHGIRRVPVCRDGRLVGIISRSDLLRHYAGRR